jgi:hypothetical protein
MIAHLIALERLLHALRALQRGQSLYKRLQCSSQAVWLHGGVSSAAVDCGELLLHDRKLL